jgi:glycosyltransferase involved in cell wall biosynthesis
MADVSLAILNKNDAEGARVVVPKIDRSRLREIFVVDGNSTDGSIEFFESQDLKVHVESTGGRGGSFRWAAENATGDYLIFLSSDGEEDPNDIPKFIELLDEGADMVIASRMMSGSRHKADGHIKWIHRRLFLRFITFLINVLFKGNLTDCWNGYRAFRLAALRSIPLDANDFMLEAQQTIRFLKAGKMVREFPTREGDRIGGASTNPVLKSGFLHLMMILRERFS